MAAKKKYKPSLLNKIYSAASKKRKRTSKKRFDRMSDEEFRSKLKNDPLNTLLDSQMILKIYKDPYAPDSVDIKGITIFDKDQDYHGYNPLRDSASCLPCMKKSKSRKRR